MASPSNRNAPYRLYAVTHKPASYSYIYCALFIKGLDGPPLVIELTHGGLDRSCRFVRRDPQKDWSFGTKYFIYGFHDKDKIDLIKETARQTPVSHHTSPDRFVVDVLNKLAHADNFGDDADMKSRVLEFQDALEMLWDDLDQLKLLDEVEKMYDFRRY